MAYLEQERATLEKFLPGFDKALADSRLTALEADDGTAIEMFREVGGPGLIVPAEDSGLGADPLEAVRVQRAIGSRSPSLAVASTMHHFSVASLVELRRTGGGLEWMLLQGIAEQRQLVASGFAEGVHAQNVFVPSMRATPQANGSLKVSGTKKPCSLSTSMDLLTASLGIARDQGEDDFAVAIIAADSAGVRIEPFWAAPVLAGAQSHAVILEDVTVDPALVVTSGELGDASLDDVQAASFLWFELLMTASYVGIASALVERVLHGGRGSSEMRAGLAVELEAVMASLEGVALRMLADEPVLPLLTRSLSCRYAAQDAIQRVASLAVELSGGMSFITDPDVTMLAAATRALCFHPPSRHRSSEAILEALAGGELQIA
jgi:alkylation response protein AidB-like acyl-CoA dehydrogenase